MKSRAPVAAASGFTLLEMLVALVLLGMLSGTILSAVKTGTLVLHRIDNGQAATDQVVTAQNRLRDVIELMRPERRLNAPGNVIDVRGSQHDFSFFGPAQAGDAPDELKRYRLLLTATGDLVLFEANGLDDRIDLDAPRLVGWQPITLLRGVSQVTLAYYGDNSIAAGRGWQVDWQNRSRVPELVRISVEYPQGDTRHWPDLMIRPSATNNGACQLERTTARCAAN